MVSWGNLECFFLSDKEVSRFSWISVESSLLLFKLLLSYLNCLLFLFLLNYLVPSMIFFIHLTSFFPSKSFLLISYPPKKIKLRLFKNMKVNFFCRTKCDKVCKLKTYVRTEVLDSLMGKNLGWLEGFGIFRKISSWELLRIIFCTNDLILSIDWILKFNIHGFDSWFRFHFYKLLLDFFMRGKRFLM